MTRTQKFFVFTGVVSLGLLIRYLYVNYTRLMDSIYVGFSTISGAILHEFSRKQIVITLLFLIKNKSDLSVFVPRQTYNILVNGKSVAKVNAEIKNGKYYINGHEYDTGVKNPGHIYSHDESTFLLPIEFSPSDLLRAGVKNADKIFTNPSLVKISVKGSFTYKAGKLEMKDYPLNESFTLADIIGASQSTSKT